MLCQLIIQNHRQTPRIKRNLKSYLALSLISGLHYFYNITTNWQWRHANAPSRQVIDTGNSSNNTEFSLLRTVHAFFGPYIYPTNLCWAYYVDGLAWLSGQRRFWPSWGLDYVDAANSNWACGEFMSTTWVLSRQIESERECYWKQWVSLNCLLEITLMTLFSMLIIITMLFTESTVNTPLNP